MKIMKLLRIAWMTLVFVGLAILPLEAEETITLPEIESGKVLLSWTELKTLLDELDALKRTLAEQHAPPPEEPPPMEYTIVDAQLDGTTEGARARFQAELSVQIFKTGWTSIRLLPADVGIEAMTVAPVLESNPENGLSSLFTGGKQPPACLAQIVRGPDGYDMIAQGPGGFTVKLTFYVPIQIENLRSLLTFTPPSAVMNRITVHIPGKAINLLRGGPSGRVTQTEEETTIETVLSQNDTLQLSWMIEKESGISRRSSAEVHTLTTVEKTMLTMSSMVVLNNLPALDQIALHLPKEVEILAVTSADIERWTTEQTEQAQILKLAGQIDSRKPVNLTLTYRIRMPALPANVTIPVVQVQGVETLAGFVGVEVAGNLDVTPGDGQNKFLIPARNLPPALWQSTSTPLLYGYEFHDQSFSAALDIKSYQEIQTVVANVDLVDCVTHRTLEGKSITRVRYFIRNNDRQFLTLSLPAQSRLWQAFLEGEPVKPAQTETGAILIPMKKSSQQGEEIHSFSIEIGYITDVNKLSLKGDLLNELPGIDVPISHLRWTLYLPENYEYTNFEGPVKQVAQLAPPAIDVAASKSMVDIPLQGKQFLFEKYLLVDETPYVRGKYGQHLGDDIFLSVRGLPPQGMTQTSDEMGYEKDKADMPAGRNWSNQQVVPLNK